jgi:lysophospholipase
MGYLQGLDSRNSTAVERGTGGFLQLSSYIAGISGGSWTVGGLAGNDWPTTQALHDDILDLSAGIFTSPNSSTNQTQYFANIDTSLTAKQSAGYQLSFIDLWGNMLQSHFLADGSNNLWSGITQTAAFTNVSYPFPLVTTNQQVAGQVTLAGNGTIWEFNPYEVGSWDAGIEAFTPTPLFGSTFNSGMATRCGSGFDTL